MCRKWKKDVAARAKKKGTIESGKKRRVVEVIDMDFLYWMLPEDADTHDGEEDEDEEADSSGTSRNRRWGTRNLGRRTRTIV
jgi:hypothetical protein